jgi:pimeloyl-ACP methyl ester carboxylesterase
MGLGTQMLGWHEGFCAQLADRGYFVIRYDNRDIGRSTHFKGHKPPTITQLLLRDKSAAAYSLADMADDGVGLLDALGIERAHVAGASMGGMIAQLIAANHPDRVLSLASIMSNTGHRWKGMPGLRIYPIFMRRPADNREGVIESTVSTFRTIGSPEYPFDEEELRRVAQLSYERGYNPAGTARQLAAIITSGDRDDDLRRISAPTVVIHGTRDLMVRPSGGRATAKAIPGARLIEIDGMGHDLPPELWDRIIGAVVSNAERADASMRRAEAA